MPAKNRINFFLVAVCSTLLLGACQQEKPNIVKNNTNGNHNMPVVANLSEQAAKFSRPKTDGYQIDLSQRHSLSNIEAHIAANVRQVSVILPNGAHLSYNNLSGNMIVDGDINIGKSANATQILLGIANKASRLSANKLQHAEHGHHHEHLHSQGFGLFLPKGANWPNQTVPYIIQSDNMSDDEVNVIKRSIKIWNSFDNIAVKWIENDKAKNAVRIKKGADNFCGWSYMGSIGGIQDLEINCFNELTLLHEMGHAAGLHHEHQRCDRDKFVTVPDKYLELSPVACKESYIYGTYDYDSIMNYGAPYVYPKSGVTEEYRGNPRNMGKTNRLSQGDIATLRVMYLGKDKPTPQPDQPSPVDPPTDDDNDDGDNAPVTKTYSGKLSAWSVIYLPVSGFEYAGGNIKAILNAPKGTSLYLQKQGRFGWRAVARLQGQGIEHAAEAGKYRWRLSTSYTAGNYELAEQR